MNIERYLLKNKYKVFAIVCLLVAAVAVLYSQNIIFPSASQQSVDMFWITLGTDLLAFGLVTFVTIYYIKRKKK